MRAKVCGQVLLLLTAWLMTYASSAQVPSSPSSANSTPVAVTVFAAASMQNALLEVGQRFEQRYGKALRFSFAASSALARQIAQGAPAALFISADEQWMDYLAQRQLIVATSRKRLLGNRLVLVMPIARATRVEVQPEFDFMALLGPQGRWVTGDPESVPVGRYAKQALMQLRVWERVQSRLVKAENVRAALNFVERGEAAAGIVYETDAKLSTRVQVAGLFPPDTHAAISYPIAIIKNYDSVSARDFLNYLSGDEARAIFIKHGFSI